jgi:hypothetical protein
MDSVALDIRFPEADMNRMMAEITRATTALNKPMKDSLKWGGIIICESLSGATKTAQKLRPIIENPNPRAQTDGRMAKWGALGYKKGKENFIPIYRTGEYGKIRFKSKTTAEWLTRDKITGEVKREALATGKGEFEIPGIMQSKKRIIGRRGFAKKVWNIAKRFLFTSRVLSVNGVPDVAAIKWLGGVFTPSVKISNKLRYASAALKGGESQINQSMYKASQSMATRIDKEIVKRTGAK